VLLRDLGFEREIELAEAPKLTPVAKQGTDDGVMMRVHKPTLTVAPTRVQLPAA
jgi:hypothetical protein